MLQNRRFSTLTRTDPNCLAFVSFPWLSIVRKLLVKSLPMYLQAFLAFESDLHRVMPFIFEFFCLSTARLVFNAKNYDLLILYFDLSAHRNSLFQDQVHYSLMFVLQRTMYVPCLQVCIAI